MEWKFKSFNYPSTWYDEKAIYGLYQRFKRSRDADATSYNQKLSFWTVLIQDFCSHNHTVIISEKSLNQTFTRYLKCTSQTHIPDCLGTVLWEMWNTPSTMRPLSDFSTMGYVSKVVGFGLEWFVKKPVSWSWNFITGTRSRERPIKVVESPNLEFVYLQILPNLVDKFLNWLASNEFSHLRPSQELNILLKSHYETALSSFFPDEKSRNFVHSWLIQNGRVSFMSQDVNSQMIEVVKFARPGDGPVKFDDDDRSILVVLQLRDVINKLENEASHLQTVLDERKAAVRKLVREKKKNDALRLLRRGKVVERALDQKHAQIEKVESLLVQIESSKGNRQLIGALNVANNAMKDALADTSRESLEDTLADLHDAYDQHQEVNEALSEIGNVGISEEELEAELDELLGGQKDKGPQKDPRKNFPADDADIDRQLAELDLSLELPDISHLPMPDLNAVGDTKPSRNLRAELNSL